jgi:hypothetical protein
LECLYSRYRIKIGNKYLKSNKGVAQGSLISPALFNIYIEDLSDKLRNEAGIDLEDLLYYADDILILCSDYQQLKKCIQIIEEWDTTNGMILNKKKSGIVNFIKRKQRKVQDLVSKEVEGIPILESYKYLGTMLDYKLRLGPQLKYIRKKSADMFVKLYPYLSKASADGRRDMWQTMVMPLFTATLALLNVEQSKTDRENVDRLWRMTFKQYLMIPQSTDSNLTYQMINRNIFDISLQNALASKAKWTTRKMFIPYEREKPSEEEKKIERLAKKNPMRGLPNTWCKFLKMNRKPCPRCNKKGIVMSAKHLKESHGIEIKAPKELWERLTKITKKGGKRATIKKKTSRIIDANLDMYKHF